MDEKVEAFLKLIGYPEELYPEFQDAYFTDMKQTNASLTVFIDLHVGHFLSYQAYYELFSILDAFEKDEKKGFRAQIAFYYDRPVQEKELCAMIDGYIEKKNYPDLGDYRVDLNAKTVTFEYSAFGRNADELKKQTESLSVLLKRACFPVTVYLGMVKDEEEEISGPSVDLEFEQRALMDARVASLDRLEKKRQDELDKTYLPCSIKDAMSMTMKRVEVRGTVFALEMKDIKNHTKHLLTLSYADDTYAVVSTLFEGKKNDMALLSSFKEGDRILVRGKPEYDEYAKQNTIRVDSIEKLPPLPLRQDRWMKGMKIVFVFQKPNPEKPKKPFETKVSFKKTVEIPCFCSPEEALNGEWRSECGEGLVLNLFPEGKASLSDAEGHGFSFPYTIDGNSLSFGGWEGAFGLYPDAPKKVLLDFNRRIELHLHTQMSQMDAPGKASDYFNAAERWGWKALGVTDHGTAAAFPTFQDLGKAHPSVRPLYGAELYLCDDVLHNIFNPSDRPLRTMRYCVFDLETSGLSCRYDRIIEFGAVIFQNGQIEDRMDIFINPDRKLSQTTVNLTHITQEMVDGGLPIKKALQQIVAFVGDATLVAHNGQFDYGFLNEALKNNGMPILKNPVIDTLPLSRYMFPELKSHRLGACCKFLGVEYDEESAHRAVYDAEVLNGVWEAMLNRLTNTDAGITHADLMKLQSDRTVQNTPVPYHVCVYARNKQGLHDLFRILSDGSIKYLNGVPRAPKSLITQYRANLLIGSACQNGEVFQLAMTKGKERVEEAMKWYDYIEVQPPCEYDWLVNDGQLTSMDDVYKIVRDVIDMAREVDKPVVATSDAHYCEKSEKIFRDVFIFAKGLKGARHPLNPYRRDKMPYYENPDCHLRTTDEMMEEFSFLKDEKLEEEIVIENTYKVASLLSPEVAPIHNYLAFPIIDHCDQMLHDLVYSTAKDWYGDPLPKIVQERLDTEMAGIHGGGFDVIYWISSKLVRFCNDHGYIVGSRGSVGSSLVATMSGISEVNPLPPHYRCPHCRHVEWDVPKEYKSGFDLPDKDCPVCGTKMIKDGHDIPFQTFIGFHAEKTPDIDLNFPRDYQAQAHAATRVLLEKESGNHVYKAGTTQTVEENKAYGYAKGYFENLAMHPETGVKVEDISDAEIKRVAKGVIGVKVTTGQHPGGIIVIPRGTDVYDFTPIQYPADKPDADWQTSGFDYNQMHDTILKFDELGHVDPMTLKLMAKLHGHADDFIAFMKSLPLGDKKVMSLFLNVDALNMKHNYLGAKVGTLALPEFGTNYVSNLILETKPKTFADLLRVQGLSHGTNVYAGNQQDLIKQGTMDINTCIGCRDDIMLQLHQDYGMDQEESFVIMEIVRHGRFKKPKPKEGGMEAREKFIADMKAHNVPQWYIDACDKIQYLFPKAHAAAYTMMALRVAWFKVYDPLAFYAGYFTCRCDQFDIGAMSRGADGILRRLRQLDDKVNVEHKKLTAPELDLQLVLQVALECVDRGYKIMNIDIRRSLASQWVIDREQNAIIPPFTVLAGLGEAVAQTVVDARNDHPFTSVEDFTNRTKVPKQKIQELADLGCLKDLPQDDMITLF